MTMNIYKAWNKGYTGKNVTICIHDPSGMEKDHSELSSRFVSSFLTLFDIYKTFEISLPLLKH